MRQESTGKTDPERVRASEPAGPGEKRGFFAAAGARLKRVMTGRAESAPAAVSAPAVASEVVEGDAEVSTSVQARARELLLHDRAHGTGRAPSLVSAPNGAGAGEEPARKTSPPPLPSQRTAAIENAIEQPSTGVVAIPAQRKRPARDSKSGALRARLGAAKAALAEVQAKRTADAAGSMDEGAQPLAADESPAPEIIIEEADLLDLQLEAADELEALQPLEAETQPHIASAARSDELTQSPAAGSGESTQTLAARSDEPADSDELDARSADASSAEAADLDGGDAQPSAAHSDEAGARIEKGAEPIRTLTIARLLARQGYFDRSLSIYDELLAADARDPALLAEAEQVRAKKRKKSAD